jgi:biotin-[acetyl-CoA-carboxylase] ligase BirA-like protein
MLVISDVPDPSGSRARVADLPATDRRAWEAVGGADEVWIREEAASFWRRLYVIGSVEKSQFDALRDLGRQGWVPDGPLACVARGGTGFHGHRGRNWVAAPGNLHLCVAAAPRIPVEHIGTGMTVIPAIAVVDAIHAVAPELDPGVKWVNDILIDGAKVAGVLTATQVTEGRFDLAVLGIGINVATTPDVRPTPFVPEVTSLGREHDEMLAAVLTALADRSMDLIHHGPERLVDAYRAASLITGAAVRVYPEGVDEYAPIDDWPAPLATGVVTAIERDLTLRIRGHPEPITRGRLAFESAF